MLKNFWILLVLVCLLPAGMLHAQGAPEQINAALAALSREVGTSITINSLDNWTWSQDTYPDSSMGCPQPGRAYAQVTTVGYKFLLTYGGRIYEYRVSVDSQTTVLCGATSASGPAATPTTVPLQSLDAAIPCAAPEPGIVYLPTRLTTNIQARVVPGPPNNQRSEPNEQGSLLGSIPGGAIFDIIAGPQCADGLVWWQANYDGQIGWTVEGRDSSYWIEPIPGAALPARLQSIVTTNAAGLTQLSVTEGNFIDALAASPDGNIVAALGGLGTNGVWLFDLRTLDQVPMLLRGTVQLLSLAYNVDGSTLLLGDTQGNLRLWDANLGARMLETLFLNGHQSDTSAVAYSPDGAFVASVGSIANTIAQVNKANAIIVWELATVEQALVLAGHEARVNVLKYSPDGTIIASASGDTGVDNTVRLWNAATGEQLAVLQGHDGPVEDLVFTPDGRLLVSAALDGSIIVWDVATGVQQKVLQPSGLPIYAVAISPDGSILATAGGDVASTTTTDFGINVWDVAAGTSLGTLQGHTNSVGDLVFNTEGTLLISVSGDHSLRFWGTAG